MSTLKHATPKGGIATRRTEHDYLYVRLNDRGDQVLSWHKTYEAARRAAGRFDHVEAINGGERR